MSLIIMIIGPRTRFEWAFFPIHIPMTHGSDWKLIEPIEWRKGRGGWEALARRAYTPWWWRAVDRVQMWRVRWRKVA